MQSSTAQPISGSYNATAPEDLGDSISPLDSETTLRPISGIDNTIREDATADARSISNLSDNIIVEDDNDSNSITSSEHSNGDGNARETVDNPFAIYSWEELDSVVNTIVENLSLDWWAKQLRHGARLARDSTHAIRQLKEDNEVSAEELHLLKREATGGFWSQASQPLVASLFVASLGAVIQGWTQSVINGSTNGIAQELDLHFLRSDPLFRKNDLWKMGFLNAAPLLSGGTLSPLVADWLQMRYFGRRGGLMIASLLTIASTIGMCFSKTYSGILWTRILNGIALGSKASIIPIYSSELSPSRVRGSVLAHWQVSDAAGIAFGFVSVLSVIGSGVSSKVGWRIMTLTPLLPTLLLSFMIYLSAVESPHWDLKMRRPNAALKGYKKIRKCDLIASKDFIYTQAQLQVEARLAHQRSQDRASVFQSLGDRLSNMPETGLDDGRDSTYLYEMRETSFLTRVGILFGDPVCRRALLAASWAMLSQNLTGINTMAFSLITLWRDNDAPDITGAWIGFGFGIVNFGAGIPSYWLEDRIGRASLMMLGLPHTAWTMLFVALCFLMDKSNPARIPVSAIATILYTCIYSFTTGPSAFAIAAEVFPLSVREIGMGCSILINFTACGLTILLFPALTSAMGGYTASLALAAALNIVAWIGVVLFVPETKGRTLEELHRTFELPLSKHIEYRVHHVMPWFWRKYLLRQDVETPEPFYRWARQTPTKIDEKSK